MMIIKITIFLRSKEMMMHRDQNKRRTLIAKILRGIMMIMA